MVHGGICAHGQLQNASCVNIGGSAQVCNDGIQGLLHNGILQFLLATGSGGFNNTVDYVCAVTDLAVTGRTLCQQLAGLQIHQHHGDGGSTDINGTAYYLGIRIGADIHTGEAVIFQSALHADTEIIFTEGGCQLSHDGIGYGNLYAINRQCSVQRPFQALNIGHGVCLRRGFHLQLHSHAAIGKVQAAGFHVYLGIFKNRQFLGRGQISSLHTALVCAGNIRNEHGTIAEHLAVTGKPPAGFIFLVGDMTGGERIELSLDQLYTAFAAGAVAGARGINRHIGASCQFQQVITGVTFNVNGVSAFNLEGYFHLEIFLSS